MPEHITIIPRLQSIDMGSGHLCLNEDAAITCSGEEGGIEAANQGHDVIMPTMDQVEYMGFPRICALSEVLWLEARHKDFADFLKRLKFHRKRLDHLRVNAHPKP